MIVRSLDTNRLHLWASSALLILYYHLGPSNGFVLPLSRFSNLPRSATRVEDNNEVSSSSSNESENSNTFQPDMSAYSAGFTTVFSELPFRLGEPSVGTIPSDLKGTYFRAGPAMFSAGSIVPPRTSIVQPRQPPVPDGTTPERMVRHPMEGDGAVLGVTFGDSEDAAIRYRFVRTAGFTNERKKGARIYTSMDATRDQGSADWPLPPLRHHYAPGLNKQRKNTSNTRTIYWGQRLFSMWEGGLPYKLDALALSTDGRSQLGGAIKRETDPCGSKLARVQDRALLYGVEHGFGDSTITLYEFDTDFALVGERKTTSVPGLAIVNDFAATENYAVFIQPSVTVNKVQFLLSKDPATITVDAKAPGTVHLIPRVGAAPAKEILNIPIPPLGPNESNVQFCNAYEEGSLVIVDAILSDTSTTTTSALSSWPWCSTLEEFQAVASKKSLWRYEIDTSTGTVGKRLLLDSPQLYFGVINPAYSGTKHRYIYTACGGTPATVSPPQGILRFDTVTGDTSMWRPSSPQEFCGEPMYAAGEEEEEEEDSGYILTVTFDGSRQESDLLIFRARDIAAGPVTRIPLGIGIPHGFHGCFAPEAVWEFDAMERRAKLADKMESRGNRWNEVKSDFSGLGLRLDDMEEYFGDFFS